MICFFLVFFLERDYGDIQTLLSVLFAIRDGDKARLGKYKYHLQLLFFWFRTYFLIYKKLMFSTVSHFIIVEWLLNIEEERITQTKHEDESIGKM